MELIQDGLLYANVEEQANSNVTKLAMTFETTENTYGTFAFSGDAVQWSVASIDRPNLSAWLVCENQQLFINLGAYDYLTPAGCADETVSPCSLGDLGREEWCADGNRFIIITGRLLLINGVSSEDA